MKQLNCVQELRGFGVLLVIMVHLSFIENKYAGGTDFIPDAVMFGHSGVDAFFVISGFMMVYINRKREGGWRSSLSFVYERLVRVYPVYWLYCIPLLGFFLLYPDQVNLKDGHNVDIINSLLLWPDEYLPLLPVAWTLIHEMYFYAVVAVLMLLPNKYRVWGMLGWAGVCLLFIFFVNPSLFSSPVTNLLANPINLEFVLGAIVAFIMLNGRSRFSILVLALGLVLYVSNYYFYVLYTHEYIIDANWRVVLAGIPMALVLYGLIGIENARGVTFAKPFRYIGDISYSAYLSHLLILSILGKLWLLSGLRQPELVLPWLGFCFVATLVWAKYSYQWVEMPSWQYAKRRNPFIARRDS